MPADPDDPEASDPFCAVMYRDIVLSVRLLDPSGIEEADARLLVAVTAKLMSGFIVVVSVGDLAAERRDWWIRAARVYGTGSGTPGVEARARGRFIVACGEGVLHGGHPRPDPTDSGSAPPSGDPR